MPVMFSYCLIDSHPLRPVFSPGGAGSAKIKLIGKQLSPVRRAAYHGVADADGGEVLAHDIRAVSGRVHPRGVPKPLATHHPC